MSHIKWIMGKVFNSERKTLHLGKRNDRFLFFWYDPMTEGLTIELELHQSITIKKATELYSRYLKNADRVS